jgi:hypothetical protein
LDKHLRMPTLRSDIQGMGWMFALPIVVLFVAALYIYITDAGYEKPLILTEVKQALGILPLPLVSLWVIGLFRDLVKPNSKELLLSLPVNELTFGLLRVFRVLALYLLVFWVPTSYLMAHTRETITAADIYLPMVAILFLVSLSFALILLVKSVEVCLTIIGVYCTMSYMMRGGGMGTLYVFHWSLPKPYAASASVAWTLAVGSICLLIVGQWLLYRREYLMK